MCIDLVEARTWLRSLNTTAKCGTILLCHISPFRSHLPIPPPPVIRMLRVMGCHCLLGSHPTLCQPSSLASSDLAQGGPTGAAHEEMPTKQSKPNGECCNARRMHYGQCRNY